jgi:arabinofuranosyltransferase
MQSSSPVGSTNQFLEKGALPLAIIFTMVMVLRVAWITEDAFIVFRSLDQLFAGNGWGYNAHERVQVFTDPLYTMVLGLISRVTGGEYYYTSIALSLIYTFGACWIIGYRMPGDSVIKATAILTLGLSASFTDFSTSGLENPLSHLLLVAFYAEALKQTSPSLKRLVFLAALAAVNRMDTLLFFLPILAWMAWKERFSSVRIALIYSWPIWGWMLFAWFYFGNWLPNTALAKLNVGIPQAEVLHQGFVYLVASATNDPILALVLGLIPLSGWWLWKTRGLVSPSGLLWFGLLCRLGYVVWVGGDYMLGRFFTESFLAALLVFVSLGSYQSKAPWFLPGLAGLSLVLALGIRFSPLHSDASFGSQVNAPFEWGVEGLVNERAFYYNHLGLVNRSRTVKVQSPSTDEAVLKNIRTEMGEGKVRLLGNAGVQGYYSDLDLHWIDYQALCDPLLSRLPLASDYYWRTGHFQRHVPAGYVETVTSGENRIQDPALAEYYTKLHLVTSGPLWSMERIKTILGFQFGAYNHLLKSFLDKDPSASYHHFRKKSGKYHFPMAKLVLPDASIPGTEDPRVLKFSDHMEEVRLDLDGTSKQKTWRAGFTKTASVVVRFYKDDVLLGTSLPIPQTEAKEGIQPFAIPVPEKAWKSGYNEIGITGYSGDRKVATLGWKPEGATINLPMHLFYLAPHCQRDATGLVLMPNPGFGIFGPYLSLPANAYSWEIDLMAGTGPESSLRADVYHVNPQENFAQVHIPSLEGKIRIPFRLARPCPNLELGLSYQGLAGIPLRISGIRLVVEGGK